MPDADRARIEQDTRRRCTDLTDAQAAEAAALAVEMYETVSAYGIDRGTADSVTSVIAAAIDGIRARDRRP